MNEYQQQLNDILTYASEHGSWSKKLLCKNADIVCAYGLGKYFEDAFVQWNFQKQFHVNFCSDKNKEHGLRIAKKYGVSFVDIEELQALNKTKKVVVVLFVGSNTSALLRDFASKGLYAITPADCIFEALCDMPSEPDWFADNRLMEVVDLLEDEESKRIFVNILANRMAFHLAQYSYDEMMSDDEYFHLPFMKLSDKEVYVDCGAYTGDTIERFLEAVDGQCDFVYAYEMAKENFGLLEKNVSRMKEKWDGFTDEKYKLLNAGVWDHKEVLSYGKEERGTGESFVVFKTDNVEYSDAVTIDETTDRPVTLIKMDIEGAELNALRGASNVLRGTTGASPKLAICLYHRLQDFWEIPMYVKALVPEYKIYVRHHGAWLGGTVMYAVKL